jgi:ribosomal-protein-alanine N-acetyltransferase
MTPSELNQIHSAAFTTSRPWSAQEFEELLSNKHTHLFTCAQGFVLVRVIAGEAELLTIAVHPDAQGKGTGGILMSKWMSSLDADEAFLEVAADNVSAKHLYARHGFACVARRSAYYARDVGDPVDAIVMRRALK